MQICRCRGAGDTLHCMVQVMSITECAGIGSDMGNFQHKAVMKSNASSAAGLTGCNVLKRISLWPPFLSTHWTHDQWSCRTIQHMEHDTRHLPAISALLLVQIVPIENIEGRKAAEEGDTCLRRTFSGVDLNRNWGTEWKQQVCTKRILAFRHAYNPASVRISGCGCMQMLLFQFGAKHAAILELRCRSTFNTPCSRSGSHLCLFLCGCLCINTNIEDTGALYAHTHMPGDAKQHSSCNKHLHNSPCCHDSINSCACMQACDHPGLVSNWPDQSTLTTVHSCFTPHASHLMPHTSCLTPHALHPAQGPGQGSMYPTLTGKPALVKD